jgi:hypothetical protein
MECGVWGNVGLILGSLGVRFYRLAPGSGQSDHGPTAVIGGVAEQPRLEYPALCLTYHHLQIEIRHPRLPTACEWTSPGRKYGCLETASRGSHGGETREEREPHV